MRMSVCVRVCECVGMCVGVRVMWVCGCVGVCVCVRSRAPTPIVTSDAADQSSPNQYEHFATAGHSEVQF